MLRLAIGFTACCAIFAQFQASFQVDPGPFKIPDDIADRPFEDYHIVFIEGLLQGIDQAIGPFRIDDGHRFTGEPAACSGSGRHAMRGVFEVVGLDVGYFALAVDRAVRGCPGWRDCSG